MFQSKYKEEGKKEASISLYSLLPETMETQHAKEASELRSEVDLTEIPEHLCCTHRLKFLRFERISHEGIFCMCINGRVSLFMYR